MKIIIEGTPIAKKRHRCGCRGRIPISYDPQLKNEMLKVRSKMLSAWNKCFDSNNKEMVIEASSLTKAKSFDICLTFVFPVNFSDSLTQKNAKLWGMQSHNIKPDFDNLEKFYADCATGILWKDDSQVTFSRSKKFYGEKPRTEIEIMVKKDLKLHPMAESVLLIFGPDKLKEFLKDVSAFWSWPSGRIDEVVATGQEKDKETVLSAFSDLLVEFANKYGNDLKKIQKYKGISEKIKTNEKVKMAMKRGDFKISKA